MEDEDEGWFYQREQESYDCRERRQMTNIKKCTCKSEYQDNKYGKGMRVHNMLVPTAKGQEWRCTVCSAKKAL